MNIPNYIMLSSMICQHKQVLEKFPNADKMPNGYICPGYDVGVIQIISVLKYLKGVETQWSCQGNHSDGIGNAYILLPHGHEFPKDLVSMIKENGYIHEAVDDYDKDGVRIDRIRWKTTANAQYSKKEMTKEKYDEIVANNDGFMKILNQWSETKIIEHVPLMKQCDYYKVRNNRLKAIVEKYENNM